MMTTDEKLANLAEAILAMTKEAAHTRNFDGEQMVGEGVMLDYRLVGQLEEIAGGPK